jgi:hypothetical protein
MKLHINEDFYLQEALNDIKKYYPNIDDEMFMTLINLDPTYRGNDSAGKYGKWLLNLYNKGNLSEEDFNEVPELLNQFTLYRNRIQNKDLNSYKTLDALADILASVVDDDSMLTDRQKLRFLKNAKSGKIKTGKDEDYDIVLETPKFIVYVPNTHEASMLLGKGTDWCTAHENPEWFNDYTKDGCKLYIIKNKDTGERWQYSDRTGDFLDEDDLDFNVTELVTQDDKLYQWYCNIVGFDPSEPYVYTGKTIMSDVIRHLVTDVIISDDITTINSGAFYTANKLQNVLIPMSVDEIETSAFNGCTSLKQIKIPDSVKFIGNSVFEDCSSLQFIKLSHNLIELGNNAFSGCIALKNIVLPKSLKYIEDGVFSHCYSLTAIKIPEGTKRLGNQVFYNCKNLKSVILPQSISYMGEMCFKGCSPNLTVYTNNEDVINEILIPENVNWQYLPNADE